MGAGNCPFCAGKREILCIRIHLPKKTIDNENIDTITLWNLNSGIKVKI